MTDLCADLLGPDVNLYWDQAVYKKPEKPRRVPWHQDNGYTYIEPQQYLTIWLALTDATEDNGCPWRRARRAPDGHARPHATSIRSGTSASATRRRRGRAGACRRRGRVLVADAAPDRAEPHRRGAQGVHPAVRTCGRRDARRRPSKAVRRRTRQPCDDPDRQFAVLTRRGARMTMHPLEPLTRGRDRACGRDPASEGRPRRGVDAHRTGRARRTDEGRAEERARRASCGDHRRARTGRRPARGGRVAHRRGRVELRRARRRAARDAVRRVHQRHCGGDGERAVAAGDAQARHRGLLEGPARPMAGGTVRRRGRNQPSHHARVVVPARRAQRQRVRAADRRRGGVRRPRGR